MEDISGSQTPKQEGAFVLRRGGGEAQHNLYRNTLCNNTTGGMVVVTNLNGGGGGDRVVTVHEDLRLNDGHKPRLLHGARVTRQPPRVLLEGKKRKRPGGEGWGRGGGSSEIA